MGRVGIARRAATVVAIAALALSPAVASAQTSRPSAVERAVTLTSPGVVFIGTTVSVKVQLEYGDLIGGRKRVATDKYTIPYSSGSGFVVSPDGTVVTASHVVEPDRLRVQNYAANTLVSGIFTDYDFSEDPFTRYRITDNRFIKTLLDQCYRGIRCEYTITTGIEVLTPVSIAGTEVSKGQTAKVLASTGLSDTDVAVLDIGGTNLPTVPLAESAGELGSGTEITALGFPGSAQNLPSGMTEPTKIFGRVSNIRSQGTSEVVEIDADIEGGMSGGPVIDEQGRVIGLTSFSLLQSSGEAGAGYLRTVDDIRSVLADAGVEASRGPVDSAFAEAMNLYWGNHFSAAVPEFQRVLALSDSHPLAKSFLAEAQSKAGTPQDVPVEEPGGFPVVLVAAIGGGLLLLGLALLFVLRARRKKPAPAPTTAAPATEAASAPSAAVAPSSDGPTSGAPEEPRRVGFQAPAHEEIDASAAAAPSDDTAPAAPVSSTGAPAPVVEAPARETETKEQTKFCTNCGTPNALEARFCSNCGHSF